MYFLTARPIWLLCLLVLLLTALAMSGPFVVRRYVTLVAPEALTAFAAAVAVLWLEHLLFG